MTHCPTSSHPARFEHTRKQRLRTSACALVPDQADRYVPFEMKRAYQKVCARGPRVKAALRRRSSGSSFETVRVGGGLASDGVKKQDIGAVADHKMPKSSRGMGRAGTGPATWPTTWSARQALLMSSSAAARCQPPLPDDHDSTC